MVGNPYSAIKLQVARNGLHETMVGASTRTHTYTHEGRQTAQGPTENQRGGRTDRRTEEQNDGQKKRRTEQRDTRAEAREKRRKERGAGV